MPLHGCAVARKLAHPGALQQRLLHRGEVSMPHGGREAKVRAVAARFVVPTCRSHERMTDAIVSRALGERRESGETCRRLSARW